MARPTTLAALRQEAQFPQPGLVSRINAVTITGRVHDLFALPAANSVPPVGVVPPSPRVCDRNTTGAMGFASNQDGLILSLTCTCAATATSALIFYDRLVEAPLSLTASGTQTVNTPALTRSTSGLWTFLGIENFAVLASNTAQVLTVNGTDHTGGAVSATLNLGASAFTGNVARVYFPIGPVAVRGWRSITSYAWDAPPTATPTDAAIFIGKVVGATTAQIVDTQLVATDRFRVPMNVDANACISALVIPGGSGTGVFTFEGLWI
jgi:hypothetical protein